MAMICGEGIPFLASLQWQFFLVPVSRRGRRRHIFMILVWRRLPIGAVAHTSVIWLLVARPQVDERL